MLTRRVYILILVAEAIAPVSATSFGTWNLASLFKMDASKSTSDQSTRCLITDEADLTGTHYNTRYRFEQTQGTP